MIDVPDDGAQLIVPAGPWTLAGYLEVYLARRDVADSTAEQYRRSVRHFEKWAGAVLLADITPEKLNAYLAHLATTCKRVTIRTKRGHLLAVLREAADERLCEPPRRVRAVKTPAVLPDFWTAEEVGKLVAEADKLDGWCPRSGVKRSAFWRAFLLVGWYAGLRLGDVLRLRWADLRPEGRLAVVQRKTGRVVVKTMGGEALEALEAIRQPEREVIFPWPKARKRFYDTMRALVRAAGLKRGTSKFLRRGGATMIAREHGLDAAAAHLGHARRDDRLLLNSYVPQDQLPQPQHMPPSINGS